jgi:hypothetical protein
MVVKSAISKSFMRATPHHPSRSINQPLTKVVYLKVGHSGVRVLAFEPAFSVGVHNGLGPGRTRNLDRSWHYEAPLSRGESDDVATQAA